MADNEKLVLMVTHGPDEPELATIPFVMAGAAVEPQELREQGTEARSA